MVVIVRRALKLSGFGSLLRDTLLIDINDLCYVLALCEEKHPLSLFVIVAVIFASNYSPLGTIHSIFQRKSTASSFVLRQLKVIEFVIFEVIAVAFKFWQEFCLEVGCSSTSGSNCVCDIRRDCCTVQAFEDMSRRVWSYQAWHCDCEWHLANTLPVPACVGFTSHSLLCVSYPKLVFVFC